MTDVDVARDDLALDALAAGLLPAGDDEVLGLLHALRSDLEPPAQNVVPMRPRKRRSLTLVGLSAAAGLVLGGITAGAVVTADEPGQLFYAAHKAVLGDTRAAERVTKLLDDAQEELAEGDRRGARQKLDKAAESLPAVEDRVVRASLAARLDSLRVRAADPSPAPTRVTETPEPDETETPEPRETESPEPRETESPDDSSGSGSSGSGSGSGSNSGKGSDDSGSGGNGSDD